MIQMSPILFISWDNLARVVMVGIPVYVSLILVLRTTGKRTLSKMNAFDLMVTVALGSTLATSLLSKDIALLESILAFALLCSLQMVVTWLSVRSKKIARLVKSEPQMLFYKGNFLESAMRKERVVRDEALQAMRSQGFHSLEDVEAIVLETNGTFSVTKRRDSETDSALSNIRMVDDG